MAAMVGLAVLLDWVARPGAVAAAPAVVEGVAPSCWEPLARQALAVRAVGATLSSIGTRMMPHQSLFQIIRWLQEGLGKVEQSTVHPAKRARPTFDEGRILDSTDCSSSFTTSSTANHLPHSLWNLNVPPLSGRFACQIALL